MTRTPDNDHTSQVLEFELKWFSNEGLEIIIGWEYSPYLVRRLFENNISIWEHARWMRSCERLKNQEKLRNKSHKSENVWVCEILNIITKRNIREKEKPKRNNNN